MARPSSITQEEKEDLRELITHEGFRVLLKAIDEELAAMRDAVVRYDLGADGGRERGLIQVKAQAEGAEKLARNIRTRLESVKKS